MSLGRSLAERLGSGDVVAFYGGLGRGKTTMIKGIARGLGVMEVVKSPSFVIVTEYEGRIPVYHIDLYRVADPEELREIGFDGYLEGGGVCLVEWADRAGQSYPEQVISVRLELEGTARRIEITGLDPDFVAGQAGE